MLSSLCLALAIAAQTDRVVKPAELPAFRMLKSGSTKFEESKTPGNVVRWFAFQFNNATSEEVESVDIRYSSLEGNKKTYEKVFNINKFFDFGLSNWGGALPHRDAYTKPFSIDYPSYLWNTGAADHMEIVAIHLRPKQGDLHVLGHLYTWLSRTSPDLVLRGFEQDSSLLTVTNPNGATTETALFQTTTVPVIKTLIARGLPLKVRETINSVDTPLMHSAVLNGDTGPMAFLKAQGQSVDAASSRDGRTALQIALQTDRISNATWLLKNGANPNLTDAAGNPPAYYASDASSPTVFDLLKDYGADLRYHGEYGFGLLHHLVGRSYRRLDMIQHLVALGLPVDDRTIGTKMTPLMVSAINFSDEISRWLIVHGARLDLKDAQGKDVLDYARRSNTHHTDEYFLRDVVGQVPKKFLPKDWKP